MVTSVNGSDDDYNSVLTYSIVAGNNDNAFKLVGTQIFVNNPMAINFETTKEFNLGVSVTDGVFYSVGLVKVYIGNANDPIKIFPANFSLGEHALLNDEAGPAVEFQDEDNDQSPVFAIMGGNVGEAFRINPCSGQLRINSTLNYEVLTSYQLRIRVNDTGSPSSFAEMTMFVTVVDENDRPVLANATYTIDENSLAGAFTGILPAFDEDQNDTLRLVIQEGDSRRFFNITPGGVWNSSYGLYANHTQHTLRLSNNVVASGDGRGEGVSGLVLDYEDPLRPTTQFRLNIYVYVECVCLGRGVGCGVWGVGYGVWGVGCGVWGVGCGGVGCGVWGVGCGVWGVGCVCVCVCVCPHDHVPVLS